MCWHPKLILNYAKAGRRAHIGKTIIIRFFFCFCICKRQNIKHINIDRQADQSEKKKKNVRNTRKRIHSDIVQYKIVEKKVDIQSFKSASQSFKSVNVHIYLKKKTACIIYLMCGDHRSCIELRIFYLFFILPFFDCNHQFAYCLYNEIAFWYV